MTSVLVATASVHTTAAACDYLGPRLGPEDRVVVLSVVEPGIDERDAGDAANVARTRLVDPMVETATREGEPAEEIATEAAERDVDEVVVGTTRGDPEAAGDAPGSTARALLSDLDRPLVVLPDPAP